MVPCATLATSRAFRRFHGRLRRGCGCSMAVATLGSDIQAIYPPAAVLLWLVGLIPTYGRVSRYGLIAFALRRSYSH